MRRLAALLAVCIVVSLIGAVWVSASDGEEAAPAWATPSAMAVKHVSPLDGVQDQPNLFGNLDCDLTGYRTVVGNTLQTGCFTQTAFGQIDSDSDTIIYNGTDEALPLLPYSGHEVLAPWPQAGVLLALDPAQINGSYISLYKSPLAAMHDKRDSFGRLTAKQLVTPPDLQLQGPDSQPLVINSQTLAFSNGGSWLVAEDLNGSFVRINLATLDMLPFAPSYGSSGSPALLRSQVAISRDGRYVAINNEAAGAFKVYDLTSCDGQKASDLSPLDCKSYDYRSFVAQKINGVEAISHVRFVNDGLLSFEARSGSGNDGIYELAPTGSINSLIDYLGLGDSYTSGEGAFDYLSGTDTRDDVCHLSANSYPLLLTHDLFDTMGGHSVACSGAEINDIGDLSAGYRGQVRNVPSWQQLEADNPNLLASVMTNFMPGYVAQERFVQQYQPGIATVSIGGDDIGFGDILQRCVEPKVSLHASSDDCFNTYEDRLEIKNLVDRTVPRWTSLYHSLRSAAPAMRLYAIGYPQILSDTGNCALNVHLSQSEREFTEEVIDYLNGDIAGAAAKAGIPYVDISQAFNGHRLCEAASYDVAVNGLTAGTAAGIFGINVFGRESYHPNALGQRLIEQAVLKQTKNFAETASSSASPPDNGQLLDAPKTGRNVYTLVPARSISAPATAGQNIDISINGGQAGLEPGSIYTVHLDGPGGSQIGTLASDSTGNIGGSVTVPVSTEPGGHTVDVTGTNQAGDAVDVTQPIYVPAGSSDSDGDGTPDSSDSCPYTINSGVDSDHDGVDDACDPLIGSPPAPASPSGGETMPSDDSTNGGVALTDTDATSDSYQTDVAAADFSIGPGRTVSQSLGDATANPINLSAKNFRVSGLRNKPSSWPTFLKLNTFNWLLWIILPLLTWWLIISLYLCLRRLIGSKTGTKSAAFRLQ